MLFKRSLELAKLLKKNSYFLFGPRLSGKSTHIRESFQNEALIIDLLDQRIFKELSEHPEDLENYIESKRGKNTIIVIDEIQKIPPLLDEVHRIIEKTSYTFLLTGSSSRKLKHQSTNMLGGRARSLSFFPLTSQELSNKFHLDKVLRYGSLPKVYLSDEAQIDLFAYTENYIEKEVKSEGLIRNLKPFQKFLKVAALCSGEIINYSKLASDTGVTAPTIKSYYEILNDLLMTFELEPFTMSKKRKAILSSKNYFFDTGVMHTLAQTENIDRNSNLYGKSFEHFIVNEVKAYNSYHQKHKKITYWREKNGKEVDLIIGNDIAIEIKSSKKTTSSDKKGLQALQEEDLNFKNYYLLSQDTLSMKKDSIQKIHYQEFLEELWAGKIF